LFAHGWWFSPGTPASSITKNGRHDIVEILLKVALKHQNSKFKFKIPISNLDKLLSFFFWLLCCLFFFDLRILITPFVSSNSSYLILIGEFEYDLLSRYA
jgi:hypothetical protein